MGEIDQVLDKIEELAKSMLSSPEDDRVLVYRQIDPLFLSLERELKSSPNSFAGEKLTELKYHIGVMARLDDPDEHPDEQHCRRVMKVVGDLRGARGFGSKGE